MRWTAHDSLPILTALAGLGLPGAVLLPGFGMPPLDIHGPLHLVGIMGALCGVTRGVAASAEGELGQRLAYNPASIPFVAVWSPGWSAP